MKITESLIKDLIREEVNAILSEELERTHNGEVVTPQGVAGKLFNLAAEVEALGEDFFSDSDSLAAWTNDFMAKHNIMRDNELDEMFNMSMDPSKHSGPRHERDYQLARDKQKTGPDHEEKMRKERERRRRLHTRGYEE